jgi:RNA polymerase sigma-70 factor, ECF subfamily
VSQALASPTSVPREEAETSFEQLYRSNRDDVYAYVAGLLRDRGAAEDVTALTFERAFGKRERFDPQRGSARAWIFGIARNAALDELRRRSRHSTLVADPVDPETVGSVQEVDHSERRLAVARALESLAGRDRELVALKFFAGLSNGEIAAVLGMTESNAGTKLHRVIEKLREACDE